MTPLLVLSKNWGIAADDVQWIVLNYRSPKWRPVSFVGSTKPVLLRYLREKGADISPEGQAALDLLPDSVKAWAATAKTWSTARWALSGYPTRPEYPMTPPDREKGPSGGPAIQHMLCPDGEPPAAMSAFSLMTTALPSKPDIIRVEADFRF